MKAPLIVCALALASVASAQNVLFTFDELTPYRSLPVQTTQAGITATMSGATFYNYSIQLVGTVGIAPVGMSGNYIFPNTVYKEDLVATFSQDLIDFSIMYAPQELATDSSCTMRLTVFKGTTQVGTTTYKITTEPFVWPTGTIRLTTTQPFNRAVVHYDKPPATGGDYGVIFVADNMKVTPAPVTTVVSGHVILGGFVGPTVPGAFQVEVRNGSVTEPHTVNVGIDGSYQFSTNQTGAPDIWMKGPHWLGRLAPSVTLNGVPATVDFDLINGDASNDNVIDSSDYFLLSDAYDTSTGDAAYNANADFNGDGTIDASDYFILSDGYEVMGDF